MSLRINMLALLLVTGAALTGASTNAHAQLQNGDFSGNGGSGQLTVNTLLATWIGGGKEGNFGSQTTPPVFVYTQSSQLQTGVTGDGFMGTVKFYGATASPSGGVVVAADGDPAWGGSLRQTVTGLTVGSDYTLSFNWAGAQQQGFSGNTTEQWQVDFGPQTQLTSLVNTPSQTFVGWQTANMTFTATSTSQLLNFLAKGSPSGEPPWLLLNNIKLSASSPVSTPEPGACALFVGMGVTGAAFLRRRRK